MNLQKKFKIETMELKGIIEDLVRHEAEAPSVDLGNHINNEVLTFEGQELPQSLIDDINNHPPMGYDDLIRWIWLYIKAAAAWLWDKLFGDDDDD